MIEARIVKLAMVGALAVFALLVAVDNLTAYRHQLCVRAPRAEHGHDVSRQPAAVPPRPPGAVAGGLRADHPRRGADRCYPGGRGDPVAAPAARGRRLFQPGKRLVHVGAGLGFLVWFFGFMVVGGEWFQMWQSRQWNGQQPAFRFYMTVLAVLIFVNQPDAELPTATGGSPA